MSTLAERAAAAAGHTLGSGPDHTEPAEPTVVMAPLVDPGIPEPGPDGPEQVPVHIAWSRVMGTVRSIGKDGQYGEAGSRGSYRFRGVDAALNAFGPACRLHGVLVLPVKTDASYRDVKTSTGKPSRECTVTVTYRIIGPAGDFIDVQSVGESMDSADKGTAKALSTSLRSFLLLGGLVPTNDQDPDAMHIERGEAPLRQLESYRDEVLEDAPSKSRMAQMLRELRDQRRAGQPIENEHGEQEAIGAFILRTGAERGFGGGAQ